MSIEVKIPPVGESIESGIISVWHRKSGDFVEAGEALLTLETDKVSTEITAETAGLLETKAGEGQEVKIGEVVALIDDSASNPTKKTKSASSEGAAPVASQPAKKSSPNADFLSPAVRRLTNEEKLDAAKITATGKGGRLTKGDVLEHLQKGEPEAHADEQEKPRGQSKSVIEEEPADRFTRKKMSPLRRKIAAQLVMSQQSTATLTTFNECDMSEVMALRKKAQAKFQADHGVKLGFMSFFIKATVEAL
ncbi:MAG TPA: biotin/lipoyl-containing protein, partial [Chthoniobacterales bacterium]|nr:biotin/lipoyl-containing protein [Chthoniobacterales bacterium]